MNKPATPAAKTRKPSKLNVDTVDKVKGLAAGLRRALQETGWSERGLSLAAGLTSDRIRNVARGRTANLRGDAIESIATVLGIPAAALTGVEPWPVGGLSNKNAATKTQNTIQGLAVTDPFEITLISMESHARRIFEEAMAAVAAAQRAAFAARKGHMVALTALDRYRASQDSRGPYHGLAQIVRGNNQGPDVEEMVKEIGHRCQVLVDKSGTKLTLMIPDIERKSVDPCIEIIIREDETGRTYEVYDVLSKGTIGQFSSHLEAAKFAWRRWGTRSELRGIRQEFPEECSYIAKLGFSPEAEVQSAKTVFELKTATLSEIVHAMTSTFGTVLVHTKYAREWLEGPELRKLSAGHTNFRKLTRDYRRRVLSLHEAKRIQRIVVELFSILEGAWARRGGPREHPQVHYSIKGRVIVERLKEIVDQAEAGEPDAKFTES